MDRRISVLALLMVLCFGLIFLQLNNLQVRQAPALRASAANPRNRKMRPKRRSYLSCTGP